MHHSKSCSSGSSGARTKLHVAACSCCMRQARCALHTASRATRACSRSTASSGRRQPEMSRRARRSRSSLRDTCASTSLCVSSCKSALAAEGRSSEISASSGRLTCLKRHSASAVGSSPGPAAVAGGPGEIVVWQTLSVIAVAQKQGRHRRHPIWCTRSSGRR